MPFPLGADDDVLDPGAAAAGQVDARFHRERDARRQRQVELLEVAREATGMPEVELRRLLDPAALARGGIGGRSR